MIASLSIINSSYYIITPLLNLPSVGCLVISTDQANDRCNTCKCDDDVIWPDSNTVVCEQGEQHWVEYIALRSACVSWWGCWNHFCQGEQPGGLPVRKSVIQLHSVGERPRLVWGEWLDWKQSCSPWEAFWHSCASFSPGEDCELVRCELVRREMAVNLLVLQANCNYLELPG